jgi:hypothetical protein
VVAADEGLALKKELVERGERLRDRPGRRLLRLLLLRWRGVAGAAAIGILTFIGKSEKHGASTLRDWPFVMIAFALGALFGVVLSPDFVATLRHLVTLRDFVER